MVLPNTGSLSGDQIDKEFPDNLVDNGRPMSLSEYRGVLISKDEVVYNLPASPNPISYSDFRGTAYGYYIDVLIVGAGGGGGTPDGNYDGNSGGGGGGGFAQIIEKLFVIPGQNYNITVGGNPDGVIQNGVPGNNGQNSSFTHNNVTYLSLGGGGGGGGSGTNSDDRKGRDGGCGGGQGNARFNEPSNRYGLGTQGKRGGGAVYVPALSSEAGGGGGTTGEGGTGWFQNTSYGFGGAGIGVGFLNGASFNVNNNSDSKAVDGFGGGGGGGYGVTGTDFQPPGANGGGRGTNPFAPDSQLSRSGYNRTGGGGGGGSRYGFGNTGSINGAGNGGTGVVIVRYYSQTILDRMGNVSGDVNRVAGNPDNNWKYLIFGRNTDYTGVLNLTFSA